MKLYVLIFGLFLVGCSSSPTFEQNTKSDPPSTAGSMFSGYLGENLLKNHQFENKLFDWRIPLGASWARQQGVNDSGVLIVRAEKPPDNEYIYETKVSQCVVLDLGDKYTLSADFMMLKAPLRPSANRADVTWYESDDCTNGGQYGTWIEPKNELNTWQQLARKNITPALDAQSALITIKQNGRFSDDAAAFWDNVYFAPTELFIESTSDDGTVAPEVRFPIGLNYLANAEFDKTINSWRPGWPTEWDGSTGAESAGSAKVTATSTSSSIGRGAFNQCVNLAGNKRFNAGISYFVDKQSTQTGGGRFRVTWWGGKNCFGKPKTSHIHADVDKNSEPGWQNLSLTNLEAPESAQSVVITIIQSVSGVGEFVVYWDDAYFIALE